MSHMLFSSGGWFIFLIVWTHYTTGERRREKVVKNIGEMFDDLNQRFHTEVTIDRKDEQWKDREKNCREIISKKAAKRCHLKT